MHMFIHKLWRTGLLTWLANRRLWINLWTKVGMVRRNPAGGAAGRQVRVDSVSTG